MVFKLGLNITFSKRFRGIVRQWLRRGSDNAVVIKKIK